MLLLPLRFLLVLLAWLMLAGFRMPAADHDPDGLLYDVRGALVTAQPDVSHVLISQTDTLVDAAIRATSRPVMLPRTILTVRIAETDQQPTLFGSRASATVDVKAISVSSGEPVAEGTFVISVRTMRRDGADAALAQKIAQRIAAEFQLDGQGHGSVVTALVERP
jgi:hypothetical protein